MLCTVDSGEIAEVVYQFLEVIPAKYKLSETAKVFAKLNIGIDAGNSV